MSVKLDFALEAKSCPHCQCPASNDELVLKQRDFRAVGQTFRFYSVACSCGVTGPEADAPDLALLLWNNLPRKEA